MQRLLDEATSALLHDGGERISSLSAGSLRSHVGLQQSHQRTEVEVGGHGHLLVLAIGHKDVWQIEDGSGMAAVHNAGGEHALRERGDQDLEEVVIADLSGAGVIEWDQGLVVSVLLVVVLVTELSTVARIMAKDNISWFRFGHNFPVCCQDVVSGWIDVLSVIHQDRDILISKTVTFLNVFFHVEDIIVATTELSLLSNVVDSNHDSTSGARKSRWHQIERILDIHRTGR
mmetsp:Transcript_5791/g.17234  ORF Transcript_5791/g.17234 Transcript_5791/m.17234 type:complete len:231 (-) Transcript_5791:210-902(-)